MTRSTAPAHCGVVGDDDERAPGPLGGGDEDVEDLRAGGGVEVAGRFVGEHDCGVRDQCACDCHSLLFSA